MGRPSIIDRDQVLGCAEQILRASGVAGLSIGAVAKAAGISKGGVQSAFGTREQLLQALYDRWANEYLDAVRQRVGPAPTREEAVQAHIALTRELDNQEADRAAGLMAATLDAPQVRREAQAFYRSLLEMDAPLDAAGRRARLALLATEGVFLLRCFGLLELGEDQWQGIFDDIEGSLTDQAPSRG